MKRKTYNNVLKATKMIQRKGYDFKESSEIAVKIFDNYANTVMPIEFYIDKVVTKEDWLKEQRNMEVFMEKDYQLIKRSSTMKEMEKIKVGDIIYCKGSTATVKEILAYDFDEGTTYRDGYHDIEFRDSNGKYRHWKSSYDGGEVWYKVEQKEVEHD